LAQTIRTDGATEWKYVFQPLSSPSPQTKNEMNVIALDRETGNPAVIEAKGPQYLLDHVAQTHCLPKLASQQAIGL
jgi:hypothetical protein